MGNAGFLPRSRLQSLITSLSDAGFRVIGPRVRDGAIVYEPLSEAAELPHGMVDQQAPGQYRLAERGHERTFAWANGPQALKPWLFAARETLWRVERGEGGETAFTATLPQGVPLAILGARACDLAALALQDAHFLGSFRDPYYAARREGLFVVAVHCTNPAATCFCASTGDGPTATCGFDLALSELDEGFLVEIGSPRGEEVARRLSLEPSTLEQRESAARAQEEAAARQTRALPEVDLPSLLFSRLDHPRWQEVAERCLSCGNCTSVCPTCFCHSENEVPSLDGKTSEHRREWDSCFTQGHSYIHGFVVRPDTTMRYRQWLTHKLAGWQAQYGRSGCVGCGRCIAWCPVGIDLTEETNAIAGGSA